MTLLCRAMRVNDWREHFGCPVLDLYSMNEAGPIAVADPVAGGHVPLLAAPAICGNSRWCTVDSVAHLANAARSRSRVDSIFACRCCAIAPAIMPSLCFNGSDPVLVDLEGRPPVRFRNLRGEWLNNIEVTHTLKRFAISQFTLHQGARWQVASSPFEPQQATDENQIRSALLELFGPGQRLMLEQISSFEGKTVQYTSDLAGSQP